MDISQFTSDAQKAAFCAQRLAGKYGHAHIAPEHILLALVIQTDNFVDTLFDQIDEDLETLVSQLNDVLSEQPQTIENGRSPVLNPLAQAVLDNASAEADELHDGYICTEHILLALCNVESIGELLAAMSVDREVVLRNLDKVRCTRTPKPGWLK